MVGQSVSSCVVEDASCRQLIDRNSEGIDVLDAALNETDADVVGFVVEDS